MMNETNIIESDTKNTNQNEVNETSSIGSILLRKLNECAESDDGNNWFFGW